MQSVEMAERGDDGTHFVPFGWLYSAASDAASYPQPHQLDPSYPANTWSQLISGKR
jgi:hypothetical protein